MAAIASTSGDRVAELLRVLTHGAGPSHHFKISPVRDHLELTVGSRVFINQPARFSVRANKVIVIVGNRRISIRLTRKERTEISRLGSGRVGSFQMVHPLLTVVAAKLAGLPPSLACAILQHESSGGVNEWGHDQTSKGAIFYGGYDAAHKKQYPSSPVTRIAYETYKSERGKEVGGTAPHQQGVGPGQLTDAWKQDQADLLGGAWKVLPNMIEAFALLRSTIQRDGLRQTIVSYNGSGPAAEKYADAVLADEREWATVLGTKSMQGR